MVIFCSEVTDFDVKEIKKEKPVLMLPDDIAGNDDVSLLKNGERLELGMPDERAVTEYFRKPEALAADRKKKGYSDGDGDESREGYEK